MIAIVIIIIMEILRRSEIIGDKVTKETLNIIFSYLLQNQPAFICLLM